MGVLSDILALLFGAAAQQQTQRQAQTVLRPATRRTASPTRRKPTGQAVRKTTAPAAGGMEDRVMVIGFDSRAFKVLLPTRIGDPGVAQRIKQLSDPKRFKGGGTSMSAGLDMAFAQLATWKGDWVRRIIIVSDGEPTDNTANRIAEIGNRARVLHASVCGVHIGDGQNNLLRSLVGATRGGWFEAVGNFTSLTASIRRAGQLDRGGNGRRGLVLLLVDTSGSMGTVFPGAPGGGRRIDALVEAVLAWRDYHLRTYSQYAGRAA
jgi:hypothetical protein